ncbi:hypothetical protein C8F04DRAFT_1271869 [Mycena alexandri]|uniref:Secreted protein n=1 Tax=Mycena alexandri TaxID=1745969 RepID=A0AAD6WQ54_9AGAR|nr:hypothetical protein C8F04DRAFT_1271869 [Mycena alexandri]
MILAAIASPLSPPASATFCSNLCFCFLLLRNVVLVMSERRLHGKNLLALELHAAQTHVAAALFSLAVDAVEDAVLVATVKSTSQILTPNVSLHRVDTLSRYKPYKLGGMLSATFLQLKSRTSLVAKR